MNNRSTILKETLIFGVLSVISSAANYAFYPVAARLSSPEFFGELNSLMAILLQGSTLLLSLNVISLYFLNNYPRKEADKQILKLQNISFTIITILLSFGLLATQLLFQSGQSTDLGSLSIIYLCIVCMIPAIVWSSYLQAHGQMKAIAIYNIMASFMRLAFCCIAIALGMPMVVVIALLLASQLISLAYLYFVSTQKPPLLTPKLNILSLITNSKDTAQLLKFSLIATTTLALIGIVTNYDIVIVRSLFGESMAGQYSASAVFGKIIYFTAATIIWFVMPRVKIDEPLESLAALRFLFIFMFSAGLAMTLAILAVHSSIIPLILGSKYFIDPILLLVCCLEQLAVSVLMGYSMYLLVQRKGRALVLAGLCIAFIGLLIIVNRQSPIAISIDFLLGTIIAGAVYKIAEYSILTMKGKR